MATKTETKGFFGDVQGDQGSESRPLLPTKLRDGAPTNNKWLMHFSEGGSEIRHAKSDNHPYINFRAEVDEPEDFAERTVFGMFFFPRLPEDGEDTEAGDKYQQQLARVTGQIDEVLGEGTITSLDGASLESCLSDIIAMLDNTSFVGKIGLERGKKVDPSDDSKDADRYDDKNKILFFEHEDTWVSEE